MKFAAAKLRVCANQVNRFYNESRIFKKNHNNTKVDFKILKVLPYHSLDLIYHLKEYG
jgi:hypothetical protein